MGRILDVVASATRLHLPGLGDLCGTNCSIIFACTEPGTTQSSSSKAMARALIGNAQLHANNSGYTNQPIIVWDPRARVRVLSDDATRRDSCQGMINSLLLRRRYPVYEGAGC